MLSDTTGNRPTPRAWAGLLIATAMVTACVSKGPAVDVAADENTIRRLALDLAAAEGANKVDSVLTLFWEDAVMQPPNAPQIQGHEAIRALYGTVTFESLEIGTPTIKVSGDLAAVWASMTAVIRTPAGPITDQAKFVVVWQRRGGVWKVLENSWSSNAPMAAPAQ